MKDVKKGALVVSLFLFLFFSYGHFFNLITFNLSVRDLVIGPNEILFPLWIICFVLGTYSIIRTQINLPGPTKFLNIVALLLVAISVFNISSYELKGQSLFRGKGVKAEVSGKQARNSKSGNRPTHPYKPDIYYIIFDSYASSSALKEYFNYDNSGFIDYLNAKGFYVASKSRANYSGTYFSLASSLNMKYLGYLKSDISWSERTAVASGMIQDHAVWQFLKSKGYKHVNYGSWWEATRTNKFADINIHHGKVNEWLAMLIQTTMLRPFVNHFIINDARDWVLYTFFALAKAHKIEGPKFIFAHIIPPHPPMLFGADGEQGPETEFTMRNEAWKNKEDYLNQLVFVTGKIKTLINEILSESEVPPIIILQADHGPVCPIFSSNMNEWENQTKDHLKEKIGILNAYYLPNNSSSLLYETITPVNSFRVIFNSYFDEDYELLNDVSYDLRPEHPYPVNITDKVR